MPVAAAPAVQDPALAHRVTRAAVTVTAADGTPLAGVPVRVEQTRHAFGFGNIGFDFIGLANGEHGRDEASVFGGASVEQAQRLADLWFDVFNLATLPFYWRGFEPERGRPDTARLRRTAEWFVERGARVKGHPLVWHTLAPQWLMDVPADEVERVVRDRGAAGRSARAPAGGGAPPPARRRPRRRRPRWGTRATRWPR